jgi:prevent-host-death family protein
MVMKAVSVAELKARLSHYLRRVERGETVLVKNRDRVVARIDPAGHVPAASVGDRERLLSLERRGILRLGKGALTLAAFGQRPRVPGDALLDALLAEREEGR